ncbi:MAG: 4-hydroxy-3-methylbut-2-enyl diphosphate reductase [Verrucomicrobia subdivision 3 bacterium]|nr:4-hydroxy-3-methylbut-2-enyl diphosphate reductase [Limisphaerales bacterium]MCS1416672.1 4-hydroxy-3-methylbut-2-enyl diphosphate reductase [Limisphaerales bacterium]
MKKVQAQVITHYRSKIVDYLRANSNVLSADNQLTIRLAKEFGFCYGVERAIDLAYAARRVFPKEQRILLLGEIIHNPEVNDQLISMEIEPLASRPNPSELEQLKSSDVVIIPAFGTEVATRKQIESIGCTIVDTTCGDVMSVWKRVRQYSRDNVTSIIHGKSWHEETMATSSQATATNGHYLVVLTLEEVDYVCDYLVHGGNSAEFLLRFEGAHSDGFDPDEHFQAIGVANQTTMLRGETEEVQRRLKQAMKIKYGPENINEHFRFFDTICGATQDRQDALQTLLEIPMDLLIVVGGYNSSNTSHLAEMGEAKLPTYFIKNAAKMISREQIIHYDQHQNREVESRDWLSASPQTIGITAGASCPNNLIEDAIKRLFELKNLSVYDFIPRD